MLPILSLDPSVKLPAIILPFPDRRLHPNARIHHMEKARVVKQAREDAAWWAKAAGVKPIKTDALSITIIFYPPDNRRRDVDGMLASLKPALDGIADVVGVDDSKWQIAFRKEAPRPPFGAVRVEIAGKGGL